MEVRELEKNADQAACLLSAMANTHRLMVLCRLAEGEKCVKDLATGVGLSQSALSQHLAKLRERRLVATRRDGQTIYYRLSDENVRGLLSTLHGLYCCAD